VIGGEPLTSPEPNPRPQLHYAPPLPLHRRRAAARLLIGFAIVVALLIFSRRLPLLSRRARLLYWQHQCAQYQLPDKTTVLDLPTPGLAPPGLVLVAPPWQKFYNYLSPPGMQSDGTPFLGELVSHTGVHRLVAVDLHRNKVIDYSASSNGKWLTLVSCDSRVFELGTFFHDPREDLLCDRGGALIESDKPLRIFAGSTDPADPSHFSFDVQSGDESSHVDGWLTDGNNIKLEYHPQQFPTPPARAPASSP